MQLLHTRVTFARLYYLLYISNTQNTRRGPNTPNQQFIQLAKITEVKYKPNNTKAAPSGLTYKTKTAQKYL
jgi:hypothetical protein